MILVQCTWCYTVRNAPCSTLCRLSSHGRGLRDDTPESLDERIAQTLGGDDV